MSADLTPSGSQDRRLSADVEARDARRGPNNPAGTRSDGQSRLEPAGVATAWIAIMGAISSGQVPAAAAGISIIVASLATALYIVRTSR